MCRPSVLFLTGFSHTSYTFYHECQASRADLEPSTVPPGALIHIVQKGLQFIELEANLSQVRAPFLCNH